MTPIKILISVLEDQEAIKDVIVSNINEHPLFSAVGYTNIEEFKCHMTKDVNLVVTDFKIGEQNALDVIMWLKLNFRGAHIIVISAYFTPEILVKLIRCRVSDVVEKNGVLWIDELVFAIDALVPEITAKMVTLSDHDNI